MTGAGPLIHVVDDDTIFRTVISRLLEANGYRVAQYASGRELLENLPAAEPGCILLDVQMEGLDGLQLQERLAEIGHPLPIVFVTGHADIPSSVRAIKAGAEDFLTKPACRETVLAAVRRATDRFRATQEAVDRTGALHARLAKLSPREREVFDLVVRGHLNKQIAHRLGMSVRTVKAHRQSIAQKLEAQSAAELVLFAERVGILTQAA